MTEPVNTATAGISLFTLAVALVGPQAGPYIVILLGSIGGSLWALSSADIASKKQGVWLVARVVITAIVLTSLIAGWVSNSLNINLGEAYAVVAFAIGALGNKWLEIIDSLKERIKVFISSSGKSEGKP